MMRRAFTAVVLLCTLGCAREGHVLERSEAYTPAPSTADVDQMCRESFLEVKGLGPTLRTDQVEALLVRQFGKANADTLMTGIQDHHVRVRRDELFMPTAALCKESSNLPRRCVEACREAHDIGISK